MKKYLLYFGLTAFLLLLIAAFTNPDEETHKRRISKELSAAMNSSILKSDNEANGLKVLGSLLFQGLANRMIDGLLDNLLIYNDYIIFSTTTIEYGDMEKQLSVGVFGKIFTVSRKDLKDLKLNDKDTEEETTKEEDAEEETAKTTATPAADVSEEEVEQEAVVLTDETVRIVDVDGPYTNIRATPNGKIIGRVPIDSRIKTARVSRFTSGKWIGIYTAADTKGKVYWENNGNYDHVGYIHRSLLRFVPNKDTHLFRTADGVLENEIGIVKRGQMCRILSSKSGYFEWTMLKIQTPDGNTGWVYPYDDEGA